MNGLVPAIVTGRLVHGFIVNPTAPGKYLCNFDDCRKPTSHHNHAVCWQHTPDCFRERRAMIEQRDLFDREFLAAIGVGESNISSSRDELAGNSAKTVPRSAFEKTTLYSQTAEP